MSNIFLYILSFSLPLIHSNFLNYFWFNFNSLVNWNFEFTKLMFFNIISSFTIIFFLLEKIFKWEYLIIPFKKTIFFILILSILSTFFSISPTISFFGNQEKAHSLTMILWIIWIFIVLFNKDKKQLEKLLKIYIFSSFVVCIIWIKEYFYPSLNYYSEVYKAISTFWNNQFLALNILLVIPVLLNFYKNTTNSCNWLFFPKIKYLNDNRVYLFIITIFIFCLFLTKSFIWITILILYLFFYKFWKKNWVIFSFLFISFGLFIIFQFLPEKIHSLLSRFYIWQNVLDLIWTNFKNIVFWNWFETLNLVFSKEKNPYLYIFENYWFIADRSHNLFLDILFSSWILWLFITFYTIYLIITKTYNNNYFYIFIIFISFCFFNFASIAHYLFLILIFVLILKNKNNLDDTKLKTKNIIIKLILFSITIFYWTIIINSFYFFSSEIYYKYWNINKSIEIFSYPNYYFSIWLNEKWLTYYKEAPQIYFQNLALQDSKNSIFHCNNLVKNYSIAENYIWCWRLLEQNNYKSESNDFYKKWLLKLPDIWNSDSKYFWNYFVKNTITWNRFFSSKYWNIEEIINSIQKIK